MLYGAYENLCRKTVTKSHKAYRGLCKAYEHMHEIYTIMYNTNNMMYGKAITQ